jgi:DNA-binding PadR family transcriptional regulator
MIQLTDKGKKLVEKIQPIWDIMTAAITDLTRTKNNLMKAIIEVEDRLAKKSFLQRALEEE